MPDVFISYSRRDKAFVRRLFELMEQHGRDTWVDWDDIEYAEDWWRKICAGIEEADHFVFVMTPDSIRSKVCYDEVDYAVNSNKRIVPVLHREIVEEADQQRMHPALRRHNWLPMSDDVMTDEGIHVLLETIAREPEHVRAHTRLLVRARDWQRAGHNHSLLLRGEDLKQAESWLAAGVNKEPRPTQLHAEYINASRTAERSRQRRLFAGVAAALIITSALAILSFVLFRQSEARREESDLRGTAVAEQAATATIALGEAEVNLRQAWETQSRLLADFSRQELAAGSTQTALLLALEALSHAEDGVINLENTTALRNALAYPGEALYMPHDDIVWNAAWSRDASQILSFSSDGTARLWDAYSGDPLQVLRHEAGIIAAVWNTDESQILTASADGTARTWDVRTGENLLTLPHAGVVLGAIWFDDDHRILTLAQEPDPDRRGEERYQGTVRVWDTADGHEMLALDHPENVRFAWVSVDSSRILTSCEDGFARIWNADSGDLIMTLEHEFPVWRAIYNEDESRILTMSWELSADGVVGEGSHVKVWDAATGDELLTLPYDGVAAAYPLWNADTTRILTASSDPAGQWGMVQVWDADTGDELLALRHVASSDDWASVPQAMWNEDESRILSWAGSTVRVWDAQTGDVLATLRHGADVRGAVWNKDETQVLAWDGDGVIQVWDVGGQKVLTTLRHDDAVQGARWNDDETAVLSWSYDGTIRLWNASNPAKLLQISYDTPFGAAAWNPDGTQVASWSGPTAAVWDPEKRERLFTIQHDGETVHGMAWNTDGSQILSWGRDGMARFWDARDGSEISSLRHDDVVLDALWSHSENRVLTRTLDGKLHIWDFASAAELFPAVRYLPGGAGGALWSPDDRYILTWSTDEHALRLWDAESGDEVQSILSEPGFIGAAWNPDGTRILYWNEDATAHIWSVEAGAEVLTLRHITRRDDLEGFDNNIKGGMWSADGSRALTWTVYGDVRIWDAQDGTERVAIDGCGDFVQWSTDESRLLCGKNLSANNGVSVWNIAQGEMVLEYPLEVNGQIDGVTWNADERRILAWKILDGATYVWNADIRELSEIGKTRTYRALSAEERERFFLPPVS